MGWFRVYVTGRATGIARAPPGSRHTTGLGSGSREGGKGRCSEGGPPGTEHGTLGAAVAWKACHGGTAKTKMVGGGGDESKKKEKRGRSVVKEGRAKGLLSCVWASFGGSPSLLPGLALCQFGMHERLPEATSGTSLEGSEHACAWYLTDSAWRAMTGWPVKPVCESRSARQRFVSAGLRRCLVEAQRSIQMESWRGIGGCIACAVKRPNPILPSFRHPFHPALRELASAYIVGMLAKTNNGLVSLFRASAVVASLSHTLPVMACMITCAVQHLSDSDSPVAVARLGHRREKTAWDAVDTWNTLEERQGQASMAVYSEAAGRP